METEESVRIYSSYRGTLKFVSRKPVIYTQANLLLPETIWKLNGLDKL
jgi:hypothetical protein